MIILLEGFDNSGKSSLSRLLKEELGFEMAHPGKKPTDIVSYADMVSKQLALFRNAHELNLIMDRCTTISTNMYNDYDFLKNVRIDKVVKYMTENPYIVIIYCRPPIDALLDFSKHEMSEADDESIVDHAKQNAIKIISRYDNLFLDLTSRNAVLRYDYTKPESFESVLNFIKHRINSL